MEDNPWPAIHVERGLDADASAVTVFGCEAPRSVHTGLGNADTRLVCIAENMSALGSNNIDRCGQCLVVLGVRAANHLAQEGWSKGDVREYLYQKARVLVGLLKRASADRLQQTAGKVPPQVHRLLWPQGVDVPDDTLLPIVDSPDDIHIVVAGGWGGAGSFCAVCPGWGYMGGYAHTRAIEFP